jgi:hypothetical protein
LGVSGQFGITFESSLDDTKISEKKPDVLVVKKVKKKVKKDGKKKRPVKKPTTDVIVEVEQEVVVPAEAQYSTM